MTRHDERFSADELDPRTPAYCTCCGGPCKTDSGHVMPPSERRRLEPRPTYAAQSLCCGADVTDVKPEDDDDD